MRILPTLLHSLATEKSIRASGLGETQPDADRASPETGVLVVFLPKHELDSANEPSNAFSFSGA